MEDASRKLDGVIVTAEKKEELLQQVPVSISSISYRQIQEYRLWNSKDLTAIVPNLYSSEPGDHEPPLYSYEPEYNNNYELGIKNDLFEKSMRLNLYAFYSNITNAQVPTLVLPEAVTITKNTGKLVSKGVEAELFTQPVRGLELGYNFGYTQAMYKSLKISQNGTSVDLAGKHQIFTPDITSMLSLQYTYPLGGGQQLKAVIRSEWKYLGTTYYNLANPITQAPYNLLNLRAGIAAKNFEVMLWDRNATDTRYFAYAYDFSAVRLGDSKTYSVTLIVRL